jgi:hypothetical protein
VFQIGKNTFYDQKNKNLMNISEFKRSGFGIITEFRRIPSGFPNQAPVSVTARDDLTNMCKVCWGTLSAELEVFDMTSDNHCAIVVEYSDQGS